jgi:tetratricopeptide (TPR) repeat protein
MVGDLSGSNQTLERFIHSTVFSDHDSGLEASPQWSARRGDLVVSFAENLIQMGDLNTARLELCGWNPIDPACPSAMERIVLRSRNIALGRILRFEGKFEAALGYLEGVLEESEQDEFFEGTGWRRVLLSNVAEILCELDRPADAEKLLMPELQRMTDRGCQNISSGRRLQLSLTESFIKRGMYGPAAECLLKLKAVYEAIGNPDAIAKRGMFRVLSSLARISHLRAFWSEALEGWQQSLKLLAFLGREEGLHSGVVWYSISHALFKLGKHRESSECLIKARGLLENHERKFWIVGFNSYWFDFIMRELGCLNSIGVDQSSAAN